MDVSKLKVADLKAELSKRGLPVSGLKKVLADRLQEAIDSEPSSSEPVSHPRAQKVQDDFPEAANGVEKRDQDESPPTLEKDLTALEDPTEITKSALVDDVGGGEDVSGTDRGLEDRSGRSGKDAAKLGQMGDSDVKMVDDSAKVVEREGQPEEPELEGAGDFVKKRKRSEGDEEDSKISDITNSESQPLPDPIAVQELAPSSDDKKSAVPPSNPDVRPVPSVRDANGREVDSRPTKRVRKDEDRVDEKRMDERARNGKVEDEAARHGKEERKGDGRSTGRTKSPKAESKPLRATTTSKIHPPTDSLYITHFRRPFTLPQVKEKLGEYGEIREFWMDGIKSRCYVTYGSTEASTSAFAALDNLQWPPSTGQNLSPHYLPSEQVSILLAEEENAKAEGKGKMELLISFDESGEGSGEWRYELRPVENATGPGRGNGFLSRTLGSTPLAGAFSIRGAAASSPAPVSKPPLDAPTGPKNPSLNRISSSYATSDPIPQTIPSHFRRTQAKPSIYWKGVDEEEAEKRLLGFEKSAKDRREARRSGAGEDRRRPAR